MAERIQSFCVACALLLAIALGGANLYFGELNQDEGWYLNAARLVAEGKLPYRDFAFTQGPALPFVYSVATPIINALGLGGGRAFTWLLGLLTAVVAARLANRLTGGRVQGVAAVTAFILIVVNVYQSYFTTVVKTYALCGLFLTSGTLLVVSARAGLVSALGGVLLVLAGATRVSAGFAVPVAGLWLLWRDGWRPGRATIAFVLGAISAGCLVLGPWLLIAPESFRFCMFEYHTAREAGSLMAGLVYKAGFVSRTAQAYLPAFALAIGLAVVTWVRWSSRTGPRTGLDDESSGLLLVLAIVGAVTLVHFAAPFPYDDYQVVLYPIACAGLAAWLVQTVGAATDVNRTARLVLPTVLLVSMCSAFSSPINQDWMIAGRDRIWWLVKEKPALAQLRQAGAWIREQTKPGDEILTQDVYLAVEAGRRVPAGLEMGPFSYYPDMTDERAATLHVVNRRGMEDLLRTTKAPVAAISGYTFAMSSPDVMRLPAEEERRLRALVAERYRAGITIPRFGQAATTLDIMTLRGDAPSP